jgi:hypothetical protein
MIDPILQLSKKKEPLFYTRTGGKKHTLIAGKSRGVLYLESIFILIFVV